MNGHRRGWIELLWRARWLTVAGLLVYGVVLVRGVAVGASEFDDQEQTSPTQIYLVHTTTRSATLHCDAVRRSLRTDGKGAFVEGTSTLHVRLGDAEHAAIETTIEFNRAGPGDSLRIVAGEQEVHELDELACFRVHVTVPIRRGSRDLRFVASQAGLRYRLVKFAIKAAEEPVEFRTRADYLLLLDAPTHKVWLGSGWWWDDRLGSPLHDKNECLLSRRSGYLAIEPKEPGRYVVRVPFRWNWNEYPNPVWSLDRTPIVPRIHQGQPALVAEFVTELTGRHVIGLSLVGPIFSPMQRSHNDDHRTIAYNVWPGQITLERAR